MGFSMSTRRTPGYVTRNLGGQPVTVWGTDADGGEDGLSVVVARGRVFMSGDGPDQCTITAADGTVYTTSQPSWDPTAHEWICDAVRITPKEKP